VSVHHARLSCTGIALEWSNRSSTLLYSISHGTNANDLQWPWRSILLSDVSNSYTLGNIVLSTKCLHMNWKAHMAWNFKCIFENIGLLKVTRSHLHGNGARLSCCYYRPLSSINGDNSDDLAADDVISTNILQYVARPLNDRLAKP